VTAKKLLARRVAEIAEADARRSVARESDAAVLAPAYTTSALEQMGQARSYGESRVYRDAYTTAFVSAWQARVESLS